MIAHRGHEDKGLWRGMKTKVVIDIDGSTAAEQHLKGWRDAAAARWAVLMFQAWPVEIERR